MRRVRVAVSGIVQGVFFRASSAGYARTLGLTGFVRNEADGTVVAEFEGDDEAVDAMLAWCRVGPVNAVVDDVRVAERTLQGDAEFRIL